MSNLNRPANELYSEMEAAAAVGISIARLHELLDKYVFTGSTGVRNRLSSPPATCFS